VQCVHSDGTVIGRMRGPHCIIRSVAPGFTLPVRVLDEAAGVLEPQMLAALQHAPVLERRPCGSLVAFLDTLEGRRRVLEIGPDGDLGAVLRWDASAALAEAAVRIPDGRWVTIEPCATTEPPWGPSDRLWLGDRPGRERAQPLVTFAAVDYTAVRAIPPLADPARLPPGAGTTVLNLLASLAVDQGRPALGYAGPYPTEQLFLALLESFRYAPYPGAPDVDDPLGAFMQGALVWTAAPHERRRDAAGVVAQLRDRVEKVTWDRRRYYRTDWQTIARHAPRRVRDDGDDVVCSLWAFGIAIEDHLRLTRDGRLLAVVAPSPSMDPPRVVGDSVTAGVVATIAATSVPALASYVRDAARGFSFVWAPVDRDLLAVDGRQVRLSARLRSAAATRVRNARDRADAVAVAFALVAEIAALFGDALRARAQASLAARPLAEQEAALGVTEDPERAAAPTAIGSAAEALLADLTAAG
jgi:hypothetical protein